MKIGHDLSEKKFIPGLGWGRVEVFCKFKEWSKPFNNSIAANVNLLKCTGAPYPSL